MEQLEFERLCRDTSLTLAVRDTSALGQGFTVPFDGVLFEALFKDGSDHFVLLAELGPVAAENRLSVYENLLTMQILAWSQPNMRFGFNVKRQALMVCVEAGLGVGATGEWLARLLRMTAKEATQWRETLLAGISPIPDIETQQLEGDLVAQVDQMAQPPLIGFSEGQHP